MIEAKRCGGRTASGCGEIADPITASVRRGRDRAVCITRPKQPAIHGRACRGLRAGGCWAAPNPGGQTPPGAERKRSSSGMEKFFRAVPGLVKKIL